MYVAQMRIILCFHVPLAIVELLPNTFARVVINLVKLNCSKVLGRSRPWISSRAFLRSLGYFRQVAGSLDLTR